MCQVRYFACRATFEEVLTEIGLNKLGYQALVLWHSDGLKKKGSSKKKGQHRMVAYMEENIAVNERLIEQESFK